MYIFIFHFLHILILTFTAVYTMHITNLSPIQRIAVAEKYRPIYEKQAKENKSLNGGDKKSESQNSSTPISKENKIDVRAKLAKTAGVSTDTYSKGKKILDSDNEKLKKEVLSGEIGGSAKKLGRCIKELERIYGIEHGNNQFDRTPKVSDSLNQEQLAEMIGISVDTLNNYKKLTKLIPELEDLVDTGIVTKTTALAIISLFDNNRNS